VKRVFTRQVYIHAIHDNYCRSRAKWFYLPAGERPILCRLTKHIKCDGCACRKMKDSVSKWTFRVNHHVLGRWVEKARSDLSHLHSTNGKSEYCMDKTSATSVQWHMLLIIVCNSGREEILGNRVRQNTSMQVYHTQPILPHPTNLSIQNIATNMTVSTNIKK